MKWYLSAAEQGDLVAELQVARLYYKWLGNATRLCQSILLGTQIRRSRKSRCSRTGRHDVLRMGKASAQDDAQALGWLIKCAEQGNAPDSGYRWLMYVLVHRDTKGLWTRHGLASKGGRTKSARCSMHIGGLYQEG